MSSGSRKLLTPTPTRRNRCCGPRATRSLSESAITVSSSHDEGGGQRSVAPREDLEFRGLQFQHHGLLGDTSKGDVRAGRFASVCWVSCLRATRPLFRRGTEALPRLNSRDHRALDVSMLLFGRGARKKAGAVGAGPLGLKLVARVSMNPGLTAHLSAIWMSGVVDPRPSRTAALVGEMT
jgi:hypothetical protein